jgi:hypothetical protein
MASLFQKGKPLVLILAIVAFMTLGFLVFKIEAAQPDWWTIREVLNPSASTNDYAAITQGQLKYISKMAYDHMEATYTNGAGTNLTLFINGLSTTNQNYSPVTLGQLKYVGSLFYDRLIEVGYTNAYPWTTNTTDDANYNMANVGQVKYIFSFAIVAPGDGDSDGDGLPDAWETANFGNLAQNAYGDYDGDGVDNITEYLQGRNPTIGAVSDTNAVVNLNLLVPDLE